MHDEHKTELILFFFGLRQNLYLYHLSTYGYARHVASGDLVDKFDDLIDKFLEVYFSKYGRPDQFSNTTVMLTKYSDAEAYFQLSEYKDALTKIIPTMINSEKDTDLLTIRDEMLIILNNTKYLFELK
jgi:hypothetical protein